jgi:hypothetical protein
MLLAVRVAGGATEVSQAEPKAQKRRASIPIYSDATATNKYTQWRVGL